MKDVSKLYSHLTPKQAATIAWGLSHDIGAAAQVSASVPQTWRLVPHIEFGLTLMWLQAVAQFWTVAHLKLLNQYALACGAIGFADSNEKLSEATARVMDCEARLLASDAAIDSFASVHGFDPQCIRSKAQLERFVPHVSGVSLDSDYLALLMEELAAIDS